MAIFTSAVFSLDMSVLMLSSLFRKVKKITWILWISPLAFFIGMIPDNWHQLSLWQSGISSVIYAISLPVPLLLLAASRIKGSRDYG